MAVFTQDIHGWESWGNVFQSIDAFAPLIHAIFQRESLPMADITHLTPGSNAVFRVGLNVAKIFAPHASGENLDSDYVTELYGMERAALLGVATPTLVAAGTISDRYVFRYLIMEYVQGEELGALRGTLSIAQKADIGRQLRIIYTALHAPCPRFNAVDVHERALTSKKWSGFSQTFQEQRRSYLLEHRADAQIYVHGDITADNVLIDPNGRVVLLDFADAVLAPECYELPPLLLDAFALDAALMEGFYDGPVPAQVMEQCLHGILLHAFGDGIVEAALGSAQVVGDLETLRSRLKRAMDMR